MKKIVSIVLVLCMIFSVFSVLEYRNVKAEEVKVVRSGNYEYQVLDQSKKYASLRKVYNYGEEVIIPPVIDGYQIIAIGISDQRWLTTGVYGTDYNKACIFSEDDSIVKKLVIPEGVSIIYEYAFNNMNSLNQLQLPDSLMRIKEFNFGNATSLKKLTLPDGLNVGEYCFSNLNLDELTLKGSLSGYDEDDSSMSGSVKKVIIKGDTNWNPTLSWGTTMKQIILDENVEKFSLYEGSFNEMVLKNPNTIVNLQSEVIDNGIISCNIDNIKCKKNNKKSFKYSWKPLKIQKHESNMLEKKYVLSRKNANGKYKPFKTTIKTSIVLNKKTKIKVKACYTLSYEYEHKRENQNNKKIVETK